MAQSPDWQQFLEAGHALHRHDARPRPAARRARLVRKGSSRRNRSRRSSRSSSRRAASGADELAQGSCARRSSASCEQLGDHRRPRRVADRPAPPGPRRRRSSPPRSRRATAKTGQEGHDGHEGDEDQADRRQEGRQEGDGEDDHCEEDHGQEGGDESAKAATKHRRRLGAPAARRRARAPRPGAAGPARSRRSSARRVLVGGRAGDHAGAPGRRRRGDRASCGPPRRLRVPRRRQARGRARRVRGRRRRPPRARRRRVDRRVHRLPAAARGRDVVAVDVGRGQLAWALRADPRVTVLERTNVRDLDAAASAAPVDLVHRRPLVHLAAHASPPALRALHDRRRRPRAPGEAAVRGRTAARVGKAASSATRRCTAPCSREVVDGLDARGLVGASGSWRRRSAAPTATSSSSSTAGRGGVAVDDAALDAVVAVGTRRGEAVTRGVGLVPHHDRPTRTTLRDRARRGPGRAGRRGARARADDAAAAGLERVGVDGRGVRRRPRPRRSRSAATARCCARSTSCTEAGVPSSA